MYALCNANVHCTCASYYKQSIHDRFAGVRAPQRPWNALGIFAEQEHPGTVLYMEWASLYFNLGPLCIAPMKTQLPINFRLGQTSFFPLLYYTVLSLCTDKKYKKIFLIY